LTPRRTMSTLPDTQQTIFPALRYRDADAAIAFLKTAFGFTEHAVHRSDSGVVVNAELKLGSNIIMVDQYRADGDVRPPVADPLASPMTVYAAVDDPDGLY